MDIAPFACHAVYGRRKLLEITHVRAKAKSGASAVFNLKPGNVEFALAAAQKTYSGLGMGKADG